MSDYGVSGLPEIAGYLLSAVAGAAIVIIIFKIIGSFVKNKAGSNLGQ
jgi:cobalt/nickel transport system permease protein